ncbi:putative ribonuclease H protein [Glycine max]|nr:putative ribonuclease H protein [Glycine max]
MISLNPFIKRPEATALEISGPAYHSSGNGNWKLPLLFSEEVDVGLQAQKQGSLASGVGIPHSGMGKGPFQKAVAAIGDVIELDDDTEDRYRLDRARLLVRTPLPLSIRTKVRVCVGDLEYRVWIVEETGLEGGSFEMVSGLRINFAKSQFGAIGQPEEWCSLAADYLHCGPLQLPFIYLGMPIGVNPRRKVVWEPIIRNFEAKLNKWNHRSISMAGRITLINAVLTALPLFYMSFFRAPSAVIKRLTTIQRQFLWGGNLEGKKIAWISWQQVCAPREKGGLGIKDIKAFNRALLIKPDQLFYQPNSGFRQLWEIKIPPTALSFAWRLLWDRLPSKENLIRRQIVLQNDLCPFCQSQVESASHLFFTCHKVMPLWWEFNTWVREDRVLHSKPMDNFLQHCSLAGSRNSNRRRKIWWIAATRSIWNLRNDMIFNNQPFDISKLVDKAIFLTWSWLRGWEKDFNVAFARRALKDPDLRMAHTVHKTSSLLGGMLFVADDLFPKTPYLHAAWHLAAAVGVGTCNKLLE